MSKYNMDFDNHVEVRKSETSLKEEVVVEEKTNRFSLTDTVLPIPTLSPEGEKIIVLKTLEGSTPEEFIEWVKSVYPVGQKEIDQFLGKHKEKEISSLVSARAKTVIFDLIVKVHRDREMFFWVGRPIIDEKLRLN